MGAVEKLMAESRDYEARKASGELTQAEQEAGAYKGQVAGAFYREELGDIDLVWGDSSKGLQHILERRTEDFIKQGMSKEEAEAKAVEFVRGLNDIIENGKLDKKVSRAYIDTPQSRALIALDYNGQDNKWVLTAYNFDDLNPAHSHSVKHNTDTSSVSRADVANGADSTTNPTNMQNVLESAPKTQGQEMVEIQSTSHTGIGELRHTLKKALTPILHTDIINKATGLKAQITGTGINKIASKKAVDKSIANGFTRDEYFKAAEHIKELYENATPKSKDKDKNASPDIVAIHRLCLI